MAGADLSALTPVRRAPSGARHGAGPAADYGADRWSRRAPSEAERPIGPWAFSAVAVCSFGGPLALAALNAPSIAADAGTSAGLATVAATIVFVAPLAIWLRYSRFVNSSGGLYAFVEAAAGRRVALAQATIWIVSYVLYLVYTTVQIVYDLLPAVIPSERQYQALLALAIPTAIAAVMIAGRGAAVAVLGLMAVGQLALAGVLDAITIAHVSTPVSSFAFSASPGAVAKASAQTSLLYICGSLPLFLGGELARPRRTIYRGVISAYVLTAVVVVLAVAPLAAAPGLLRTDVPGVRVAQEFAGAAPAEAIGIGIAVSIAGVIICEYLAVTRLVHAIGPWRLRPVTIAIGALMVLAAPLSLIDPHGFYTALIKPSLIALWLSQLIVFVVYPRFAAKQRQRRLAPWLLTLVSSPLAIYGLWTAVQQSAS